eukprot:gene24354-10386_t
MAHKPKTAPAPSTFYVKRSETAKQRNTRPIPELFRGFVGELNFPRTIMWTRRLWTEVVTPPLCNY